MVKYQVFLSFRGPEARKSLAQHLHNRLTSAGITTFLDHEAIQFGQNISNRLIDAIRNSDICVPIFSQDFASSAACLTEVAKMVELGKKILPIFFFVTPSDVRHQRGTYETSFKEHEKHYPQSTIEEWRTALTVIADTKGLEFKHAALEIILAAALKKIGGKKVPESRISAWEKLRGIAKAALEKIGVRKGREITKADLEAALAETGGPFYKDLFEGFQTLEVFISDIWKLSRRIVEEDLPRNLVGLERGDVQEMMRKLGFYYQHGVLKGRAMTGRSVLVVSGMPRVGKTTLAKVVFHNIRHLFQGSSSLEDVRHEFEQKKVVSLQNKLIRELRSGGRFPKLKSPGEGTKVIQYVFRMKRVLILLDNVDQWNQIKTLAKELTWFGQGSVIILTTTKKSVIDFYKNQHPEQNECIFFNDHRVLPLKEAPLSRL